MGSTDNISSRLEDFDSTRASKKGDESWWKDLEKHTSNTGSYDIFMY